MRVGVLGNERAVFRRRKRMKDRSGVLRWVAVQAMLNKQVSDLKPNSETAPVSPVTAGDCFLSVVVLFLPLREALPRKKTLHQLSYPQSHKTFVLISTAR